MKLAHFLLLCALCALASTRSLREFLPSYANRLDTTFESIEQRDPCIFHKCEFPSRCITMPNTGCPECRNIPMCAHFG